MYQGSSIPPRSFIYRNNKEYKKIESEGKTWTQENFITVCLIQAWRNVIVNGKKKFFDWFDEKIVYIGIKNEVRIRDDLGSEIDDYAWKKYAWSVDRYFDKQKTETEMTQAEIEDSFFINAKRYFLQYAKRQSEPIFDVAKQELEHIENNTHSVCEDDDLKKFRTVSKRIQIGVLIEIMGENGGE